MKESGEVTREELMLFTALWEKRSLTAAAEQLGIHLPKASRLLKSLRESFSDDLFIRIGNTMEPTRKASALLLELRRHSPRWSGCLLKIRLIRQSFAALSS